MQFPMTAFVKGLTRTSNRVICSILPGVASAMLAGVTFSQPVAAQCVSGLGASAEQIALQDWSASPTPSSSKDLTSLPARYPNGTTETVSFGPGSLLSAGPNNSVYMLNSANGEVFHIGWNGMEFTAVVVPGSGYTGMRYVAGLLYLWKGGQLFVSSGVAAETFGGPAGRVNGIAFDGQYLWVAADKLYKFTPAVVDPTGTVTLPKVIAAYPVMAGGYAAIPKALAFDGQYLWAASGNSMVQIDPETGEAVATVSITHPVSSLTFDGYFLWLTDPSSSIISKMDVATREVIDFPTAKAPVVATAFDGGSIWVANAYTPFVTILRACDGGFRGTLPVVAEPAHIAYDGVHKWITYSNNNVLSVR